MWLTLGSKQLYLDIILRLSTLVCVFLGRRSTFNRETKCDCCSSHVFPFTHTLFETRRAHTVRLGAPVKNCKCVCVRASCIMWMQCQSSDDHHHHLVSGFTSTISIDELWWHYSCTSLFNHQRIRKCKCNTAQTEPIQEGEKRTWRVVTWT